MTSQTSRRCGNLLQFSAGADQKWFPTFGASHNEMINQLRNNRSGWGFVPHFSRISAVFERCKISQISIIASNFIATAFHHDWSWYLASTEWSMPARLGNVKSWSDYNRFVRCWFCFRLTLVHCSKCLNHRVFTNKSHHESINDRAVYAAGSLH